MGLQRKFFLCESVLFLLLLATILFSTFWIILTKIKQFEVERSENIIIPSVYKRMVHFKAQDLTDDARGWVGLDGKKAPVLLKRVARTNIISNTTFDRGPL